MTSQSSATPGRRALLGSVGILGLGAALSACTTGSSEERSGASSTSGAADADFPRSIEHVHGTTRIEKQPQRVAAISWVNPDHVLALGVVPVGMDAVTWGGNKNKSTDWLDAALADKGAKLPALYAATDGLDLDGIAASAPDVIIAAYSGLTKEQYDQLAKIAPTIAYPKDSAPWGTSWQDSLALTARALGKDAEAKTVTERVEKTMSDFATKNTALKDTTFVYGSVDMNSAQKISFYTDIDNRPRFLEELGMKNAEVITKNQKKGEFSISWSTEKADELVSDVLVAWFDDEAALKRAVADPLIGRIPAIAAGHYVAQTDQQQVLSISASSALSLPWALTHVMAPIVEAAEKAAAA